MKSLLVLLSLAFATTSSAALMYNFECGKYQHQISTSDWMTANLLIQGNMVVEGETYTLKSWEGYYHILDVGADPATPYTWAFAAGKGKDLVNLSTYRPRKYKNHIKLEIPFSSFNMSYGQTDLILPKMDQIGGKTNFTGFMIMTAIEDHMGDTIPLNCQRGYVSGQVENNVQPLSSSEKTKEEIKQCVEACQALFQPGPQLKSCVIGCYRR